MRGAGACGGRGGSREEAPLGSGAASRIQHAPSST